MSGSPLCRFCGRAECKCGEPFPSKSCPRHGKTMQIVSIASRRPSRIEGIFDWKWFQAVICSKCPFMRPLKTGQGVPRNENRKTNAKKKEPVIDRLQKKFGAQVRSMVDYTVTEQETRGIQIRFDALLRASRESDKGPSESTRTFQDKLDAFWEQEKRAAQIKADQDVPF